jgi:hypothetical protein
MSMGHKQYDSDRKKRIEKILLQFANFLPKIPHGMAWFRTLAYAVRGRVWFP